MPPLAVTVAEPVEAPKHPTLVELHNAATAEAGWVTIDSQVAVQPLASVTVTVYVPAANPLIDDDIAVVLHK